MSNNTADIIIPCYNTGRYLRQAIDSALAQTYPHINILVVDDGSTDDTRGIVESYQDRVSYFYQENKGLPAARNAGIRQTAGEYVCVLDADDVILPHMIEDQAEQFERDQSVDIMHGKTLAFDGDDIVHPYAEVWRPHRSWRDYGEPLSVICAIHLGSSLIRRSCFQRFGLFAEGLSEQGCEDWAYWLNCAMHGAVFKHVPRVHGLYRQHAGSMSSSDPAICRRESELIKSAARMFELRSVTETRRLRVLSCGIKSIAARWLPLGKIDRFQELLDLSNHILASTGQETETNYCFDYSADTPASLVYLALSKEFFDLELEDLAIVMFIKCGDIRTLKETCDRLQQSELFEAVVGSLAAAVSGQEIQHVSEPHGIPGAISVETNPASPPPEGTEFYFELERIIPHHASFHGYVKHQLGLLEESRGNIEKAEREIRDSIPLNPNYSYAYFDLGIALQIKGDFAGAEKELRASIELRPDFTYTHYELARCLEAQGDPAGAEEEVNRSIELKSDFSYAHHYLGCLLEARGDFTGAEKELRISIKLTPDFSFAYYDLGRVLEARGDFAGAEDASKTSITLNPDFIWGHFQLGRLLEARGDYVGAEQEFLKCLALDSGFVLGHLAHAKVLAKTGRYGGAAAQFLRASRIDPRATGGYLIGWVKAVLRK